MAIRIEAHRRLLAYDNRWSQKVNRDIKKKYQGEQKPAILVDDTIFKLQPAALAARLRELYKDDYRGAMGAITLFKNRAGKTLLSTDRQRLEKAQEALRKVYKKEKPKKVVKPQDLKPVGLKPTTKPIGATMKIEAAARIVQAEKWSQKVTEKVEDHPPEGLFKKGASAIARGLKKLHPDLKGAMSALNFYINRAGDKVENKENLEKAKDELRKLYGE